MCNGITNNHIKGNALRIIQNHIMAQKLVKQLSSYLKMAKGLRQGISLI